MPWEPPGDRATLALPMRHDLRYRLRLPALFFRAAPILAVDGTIGPFRFVLGARPSRAWLLSTTG